MAISEIDPDAGTASASQAAQFCLNCGTQVHGNYCHSCGQAVHVHRTLGAIWHGFVHGVLHLDGKLWLTLSLLFRKPGELTRRYIAGERVKFVSPLALFLFSMFLMFGIFSVIGGPLENGLEMRVNAPATAEAGMAKPAGPAAPPAEDVAADTVEERIDTGNPRFDASIAHAIKEPGLFLAKMQFNIYKFSWAIIILAAPFVSLLFVTRTGFGLYDHTVFATYSITAMSLLLALVTQLDTAGSLLATLGQAMMILFPPWHMFQQVKGAYRLTKGEALWRTFALIIMAFAVLGLFAILMLALGLMH